MKRLLLLGALAAGLSLALPMSGVSHAGPVGDDGSRAAEPTKRAVKLHGSERSIQSDSIGAPQGIAGGYVFVPVTPYRTYDSRAYSDGYLLPGEEVYFEVLTDAAGNPKIPATAVAVTYNLTVAATAGGEGYLAMFPANADWPGNSSINWTANGTTLANGGTVAIGFFDAPGQVSILHGPPGRSGGTHVILDITGYYI